MNYSKRWPIGIAIIYAFFILFLVGFVIFSQLQQVDLVSDNYYDQEIKYQQQLNRIDRAQSLSKPVYWIYDNKMKAVIVNFPPEINPNHVRGNLLFFRPSDANQDNLVPLNLSDNGTQKISTKNLMPGLWKIKVSWQVHNHEYYNEGVLVLE
jgi:hypothetical protein